MGPLRIAFSVLLLGCGGAAQNHAEVETATSEPVPAEREVTRTDVEPDDRVAGPPAQVYTDLETAPLEPVHLQFDLDWTEIGPSVRLEGRVLLINGGPTPIENLWPARHSGSLGWRIVAEDGSEWTPVFLAPPPPIPNDPLQQAQTVQPGGTGYVGRLNLVGGYVHPGEPGGASQDRLPPGRYRIVATTHIGELEVRSAAVDFVVH